MLSYAIAYYILDPTATFYNTISASIWTLK